MVHISSVSGGACLLACQAAEQGFAALAAALVLKQPRRVEDIHSVPLVSGRRVRTWVSTCVPGQAFIGGSMIWFGWLVSHRPHVTLIWRQGFNGGSALNTDDGVAALAYVNTNVSAAAGFMTWVALESCSGRPSAVGARGARANMLALMPVC